MHKFNSLAFLVVGVLSACSAPGVSRGALGETPAQLRDRYPDAKMFDHVNGAGEGNIAFLFQDDTRLTAKVQGGISQEEVLACCKARDGKTWPKPAYCSSVQVQEFLRGNGQSSSWNTPESTGALNGGYYLRRKDNGANAAVRPVRPGDTSRYEFVVVQSRRLAAQLDHAYWGEWGFVGRVAEWFGINGPEAARWEHPVKP